MLEGITVLSQSAHQFTIWNEIFIIILCLLLALVFGFMAAVDANDCGLGLIVGIVIFVAFMILFNSIPDKSTYTTYKVTISDEVNFTEFADRYEIISQEGQIYEIREKEIK